MGKMLTFVFTFGVLFFAFDSYAQTAAQLNCTKNRGTWINGKCVPNNTLINTTTFGINYAPLKAKCEGPDGGVWSSTTHSCNYTGKSQQMTAINSARLRIPTCGAGTVIIANPDTSPNAQAKVCGCPTSQGTISVVAEGAPCTAVAANPKTTQTCDANSKSFESTHDGMPAHVHCRCNYENEIGQIFEYDRDNNSTNIVCPKSSPQQAAAPAPEDDQPVFECLQTLQSQINACKKRSGEAMLTCDSRKNESIREPISTLANAANQLVHAGTLEQCRNMSYVSAAAAYGLGQIKTKCEADISQCRSACGQLDDYVDVENVMAYCQQQGGNGNQSAQEGELKKQAARLAKVMSDSSAECSQPNSSVDQLMGHLKNALTGVMQANQSTIACQSQLQAQCTTPSCRLTPMTDACLANPNGAGCPVNCATAAGAASAQCKCLMDPASCKGGTVASIAGGSASKTVNSIGGTGAGTKSAGSLRGLSGDDLNLGDASEKSALIDGKENGIGDQAHSGVAPPANAGGGGSAGGGPGSGKPGAAEEAAPEKSLIGGAFQTMKSAASSLINSFGGKKPSGATPKTNESEYKLKTSTIRGVASSNRSCWVDGKGTEICFGGKSTDIFQLMNLGYKNQSHTFILDK